MGNDRNLSDNQCQIWDERHVPVVRHSHMDHSALDSYVRVTIRRRMGTHRTKQVKASARFTRGGVTGLQYGGALS